MPPDPTACPSDDFLVAGMLGGDWAALNKLIERYDRLVRYTILRGARERCSQDPQWLESVASATWAGFVQSLQRHPDQRPKSVRAYLAAIARNQVVSALRGTPALDEAAFIDGLQAFSEITGRYPNSLYAMDLMYEVSVVVGSLQAKQLAAEHQGNGAGTNPDWHEFGRRTQGMMLYTILEADGREPEYFGKEVKPGDAECVLLSWTLDDGQVRVIYGDLSSETVTPAGP